MAMYFAYSALFSSRIAAVLRRISIRFAGLVFDQLTNAFAEDSTALCASSVVADAALQHVLSVAGLVISKVDEPRSSLPSIQRGTETLVSSVLTDEAIWRDTELFVLPEARS
jgi:hypothetical protein